MRTRLLFTAFGLSATFVSAHGQLQNGSFEEGTNPPATYVNLFTGNTSISDWSISGEVTWLNDAQHPTWAEDGNMSIEPVGLSGVSQTFGTTGGTTYNVAFWINADYGFGGSLDVYFNNNGGSQHTSVPIDELTPWTQVSLTFTTAPGTTSSTLAIDYLVGAPDYGPLIDNVMATPQAVPEPASWAALGLGALGLSFRKRRRAIPGGTDQAFTREERIRPS